MSRLSRAFSDAINESGVVGKSQDLGIIWQRAREDLVANMARRLRDGEVGSKQMQVEILDWAEAIAEDGA